MAPRVTRDKYDELPYLHSPQIGLTRRTTTSYTLLSESRSPCFSGRKGPYTTSPYEGLTLGSGGTFVRGSTLRPLLKNKEGEGVYFEVLLFSPLISLRLM